MSIFQIIIVLLLTLVYFLPFIFSVLLKKHKEKPVFIANLFLGWTGIGWVAVFMYVLFVDNPSRVSIKA